MLRYAISDDSFSLGRHQQPAPMSGNLTGLSESSASFSQLRKALLAHAAYAAGCCVDYFLLRERSLPAGHVAALSRDLLDLFASTSTHLLIHSRSDVAVASEASGVHLPSTRDQLTPEQIRDLYASAGVSRPIVSLSCHTREDLHHARDLQPDLILYGPIFGKHLRGSKIQPGIGVEALRAACALVPIPVLALGGITEADIPACLEAGAAGIAAIRLFRPPRLE